MGQTGKFGHLLVLKGSGPQGNKLPIQPLTSLLLNQTSKEEQIGQLIRQDTLAL